MTVRIVDTDKGFKAIVRAALKSDGLAVNIGVQPPESLRPRGKLNLAGIASVLEFGSPSRNIPERSAVRSTVDENRAKYNRQFDAIGKAVASGKGAVGRFFVFGELVRADIVRKIKSNIPPPLKPKTIARKRGETTSWIDTGLLLSSITTRVFRK